MGDKTTKKRGTDAAFAVAAKEVGVSVHEFKLWVMEHKDPSPTQWSHWKHGRRPIPDDYLLEFLREHRNAAFIGASR